MPTVPEGQSKGYEGAPDFQTDPAGEAEVPIPEDAQHPVTEVNDLPDIPERPTVDAKDDIAAIAEDTGVPADELARLQKYISSGVAERDREAAALDDFVDSLSPGTKWRAAVFDGSSRWSPEKAARFLRMAEKAGVTVDLAENDPVFTNGRIIERTLPEEVSKTLEKNLNDPVKAAVLWEDVAKLDEAERTIRKFETLKEMVARRDREAGPLNATNFERLGILWEASRAQTVIGELGSQAALSRFGLADPLTEEQQQQYRDALEEASRSAGEITGFAGFLEPAVSSLDPQLEVYGEGLKYGAAAFSATASATAAATAWAEAFGPPGAVAQAGSAIGAGLTAAGVAAPVGMALKSAELEIGMARAQYSQLRVDGKPLDPATLDMAAIVGGTLSGALEFLPGKLLTDMAVGATGRFTAKHLLRKEVEDMLKTPTGRDIIKRYATKYAELVASEGVTEGLQDWVVRLYGEIAKLKTSEAREGSYTTGDVLETVFSGEALANFVQSAMQGGQAAMVFAAPGVTVSAALDYAALDRKARDGQETIDKVVTAATSAKAFKYAPDLLKQHLNEVSEDSGKKIYIDPDAVDALATELKQSGKDETTVSWLAGIKEKAERARKEGRDVEMGYGDMVEIVSSPDGKAFRHHIRPDIDAPSQAEIEKYLTETESLVSSELKRAAENVRIYEESKQVYEEHLAALKDSDHVTEPVARKMARIVPAWVAAKAKQLGVPPVEIADKLNLKVEGPMFSRDPRAVKLPDEVFTDDTEAAIREALLKDKLTDAVRGLKIPGLVKTTKRGEEKLDRRFARGLLREKLYRAQPKVEQAGQRGSFDPAALTIKLDHAADLSTFIHESAHFILEAESRLGNGIMSPLRGLEERIAEHTGVEASRIYRVVAGAVDDAAAYRAVHEFFATEFERYLAEGKAPEASLRDTFRSARQWMLYVYKDTPEFLGDGVKPEMRELFDRLLAIEAAVQEQSVLNRYRSMTEGEAQRPIERRAKRKAAKEAEEAALIEKAGGDPELANWMREELAKERLTRRWEKQLKKQKTQEWKQKRAHIMEGLIPKLREEQRHRLRESMKSPNGVKLDRKTVKEILGVKKTPANFRNMTVEKGGMLPDDLADFANLPGIESGEQLVRMLAQMQDVEKEAYQLAEQQLRDELGDLLNPDNLRREAEELVKLSNSDKVLKEFIRLNKAAGKRAADVQAIKAAVAERIDNLRVKDLSPREYHDAEIRAARLQTVSEMEGDIDEAARQAEIRLINYYLWKYSTDKKKKLRDAKKELKKIAQKKNRDAILRAGEDYWDRISVMLARMDLIPQDEARGGIEAFNEWMSERLGAAIKPPEVLQKDQVTSFDDLTVGQALAAYDSVTSLRHMARRTNEIKLAEKTLDYERTVKEVVDTIRAARGERDLSLDMIDSGSPEARSTIKEWRAKATSIPWLLIRLQGFKRIGPLTRIFDAPFNDALNRKHDLHEMTVAKVAERLANMSREQRARLDRRYDMVSLAVIRGPKADPKRTLRSTQLTGWQLIVAALNFGTQANLQKFLEGYGLIEKGETATTEHPFVQEVLDKLETEDIELVKLIWDQYETLFPYLKQVHMDEKGVRLRREKGITIKSRKHGVIKGNYYPIIYDRRAIPDSGKEAQSLKVIEKQVDGLFSWPGFTDLVILPNATFERVEEYSAPMMLDLTRAISTMEELIHFITHYKTVKGLYRIIKDPRVEAEIKKAEGVEHYEEMKTWIKEIAGERTPVDDPVEQVLGSLRYGSTLAILGASVTTLLNQPLGLVNSIGELGGGSMSKGHRLLAQALAQLFRSKGALKEEVLAQSKILRHRIQTADRERKHALEVAQGKSGRVAKWNIFVMSGMGYVQLHTVDIPTWIAAKQKYLDEHRGSGKGDITQDAIDEAIEYADSVVVRLQGSGEQKDLPFFLRSSRHAATKLAGMFMTFFMATANAVQDAVVGRARGAYTTSEMLTRLFYAAVAPTVVSVLIKEGYNALVGDDDDEEKALWQKFVEEEARYLVAGIPLGSMFYSMVAYNKAGSAPLEILNKGLHSTGKLVETAFGEESMSYYDWKNIASATSMLFKVGGGVQLARTTTGATQSIEQFDTLGVDEIMDRVLFGAHKE